LPPENGDFSMLKDLIIHNNNIGGNLPSQIGNLTNLEWARLHRNQFTGTIPASFQNLVSMVKLELNENLFIGNIPAGLGNLPNLEELQLHQNTFTGDLPNTFSSLTKLKVLTVRNNQFTYVPNLSLNTSLAELKVQGNRLHFDGIEHNIGIGLPTLDYIYTPQAKVGVLETHNLYCGEQVILSVSVGGVNNTYKWFRNGTEIPGATNTTLNISSMTSADAGTYHCEIRNTVATALVLTSENKVVNYLGATAPVVASIAASGISNSVATISGNVSSGGCETVTERGFFWGASANVITTGTKVVLGSGTGSYFTQITALSPNTTYYFRAYAINSMGTAYGDELSFVTLANLPTVITADATNIQAYSATLGGNATSGGGLDVLLRGVYYSTEENPETTGTQVVIGHGLGVFSDVVEGLSPGTLYYFKAFATNTQGMAYGEQKTFTTLPVIPVVFTEEAYDITHNSAIVGGYIEYNGGAPITSRGVYWGIQQNPSTTGTQFRMGTGAGDFFNTLTDLQPVTTYYVQAFATNIAGTAFGEQVEFTTLATIPDVETIDASDITSTSARINGQVVFDGGSTVFERGFYWGLDAYPMENGELVQLDPGDGMFSQYLDGLEPSTYYYFQAFAINSEGMGEGEVLIFFTELAEQIVFIPTAFNPYSSIEVNRTFKPIFEFTPSDYVIEVYNRWGSRVFYSDNFNDGWNGFANGVESPIGPYQYKVRYTDEKGEKHIKIGVVNLVK